MKFFAFLIPLTVTSLAMAQEFEPAKTLGIVKNPELIELSGIVVGGKNPEVLWVHNDRQNLPRLYALDMSGKTVATFRLDAYNDEGTMSGDWEDIARIPGKGNEPDKLYIADFGNNPMAKREHRLLVVTEPNLNAGEAPIEEEVEYDTIRFEYPGDYICNSECLLIHPVTGEIFIVSKQVVEGKESRPSSAVWSLSGADENDEVRLATKVIDAIPAVEARVTGGDISVDGRHLIIRTNELTAFLWEWKDGQSIVEVLMSAPVEVKMADEKGGEAICFSSDGARLYTVYDGKKTDRPLHAFDRK